MPRRVRRRGKRRRPSSRAFGSAVRKILNAQVETKRIIFAQTDQFLTNAGRMLNVFNIGEGSGDSQRVGDRIKLMAIHIEIRFLNTSATGLYPIRAVLFKRKGPYDGTQPAIATLNFPLDPNEFVTKKDSYFFVTPASASSARGSFDYHKRWGSGTGGQLVQYTGGNGTDMNSGAWQIYLDTTNTAAADVLYAVTMEVFYKDA